MPQTGLKVYSHGRMCAVRVARGRDVKCAALAACTFDQRHCSFNENSGPSTSVLDKHVTKLMQASIVLPWLLVLAAPKFGSGLSASDLSTIAGYTQNYVTWWIKQAAMPLFTGLLPTPWSAVRDRLHLPRTATGCPLVDGMQHLMGKRVRRCDVLLNAIMVREGASNCKMPLIINQTHTSQPEHVSCTHTEEAALPPAPHPKTTPAHTHTPPFISPRVPNRTAGCCSMLGPCSLIKCCWGLAAHGRRMQLSMQR